MQKININDKNIQQLKELAIFLYKKKIKLLLEKSNGNDFKKSHEFKKTKKDLARILTSLTKKEVKKKWKYLKELYIIIKWIKL